MPLLLPYMYYTCDQTILSPPVENGQNSTNFQYQCDGFRPISILPFLSKVCEQIMHSQINEYVTRNNLLVSVQSQFHAKHSCTTALMSAVEDIREKLDKGHVTFLVFLEFSKAFDMVDHSTLIYSLTCLPVL